MAKMGKEEFIQRAVLAMVSNSGRFRATDSIEHTSFWEQAKVLWESQPKAEKPKKEITPRFVKPTPQEVDNYLGYLSKRGLFTGSQFVNFYESKGWMVGSNKMKSWKAAVNTWVQKAEEKQQKQKGNNYSL